MHLDSDRDRQDLLFTMLADDHFFGGCGVNVRDRGCLGKRILLNRSGLGRVEAKRANQLVTVHAAGDPIPWHYTLAGYSSLTENTPNGTRRGRGIGCIGLGCNSCMC